MEPSRPTCSLCGKSFDSKTELLQHQAREHAAMLLKPGPQPADDEDKKAA